MAFLPTHRLVVVGVFFIVVVVFVVVLVVVQVVSSLSSSHSPGEAGLEAQLSPAEPNDLCVRDQFRVAPQAVLFQHVTRITSHASFLDKSRQLKVIMGNRAVSAVYRKGHGCVQ